MEDPNAVKARQIIVSNRYLSLATFHGDQVWVAPLAYAVDDNFNFYFYSAVDSLHIQHIKHNPRVAFAIFDSRLSSDEADGIQASGIVGQVEDATLPQVMELYWKQLFPDVQTRDKWMRPPEHFRGSAIQRFFQIQPVEIYKLDTSIIEVDRRVQIDLKALRRLGVRP